MLHIPLTLDVSSQWFDHVWLMAGNSTTVTGTLAHSYFLLPDLWVCKSCTSYIRSIQLIMTVYLKEICLMMAMGKVVNRE